MKSILYYLILNTCFNIFVDAMYNGEYRSVKDYPYMVQLYYEFESGETSFCGATIISEYWVISAAHCVGYPGTVKKQVRLGSSTTVDNGMLIDMEKIFVHGDCDEDFYYDNDIALIKLKTPIEFNEYQRPIPIAKESPKVGENVTVLGFGYHHHYEYGDTLRVAETSVIDNKECYKSYNMTYSNNMICTSVKRIDLCFGDSGGPAVFDNKLVGILSRGCEYIVPNVLTKVANYYDWILQTTGINNTD